MIDLGRLRALHAVALYGSVNRAAEALGYTPSAVSQQLAKLERETRTVLVERRGRGIVLTDAAQQLASTASRVLELVEDAELTLEEQRGQAIGTLTIAAFPTAARGLLPNALSTLMHENPGLDVRVTETDPFEAVAAVNRGEIHVAVVHDWHNTPLALPEGLSRTKLGSDPADVLVPATHRLAGKEFVRAEDLVGERWICQPDHAPRRCRAGRRLLGRRVPDPAGDACPRHRYRPAPPARPRAGARRRGRRTPATRSDPPPVRRLAHHHCPPSCHLGNADDVEVRLASPRHSVNQSLSTRARILTSVSSSAAV
jgi:DNA-binding transcriptional LysR family regulator